MQIIYITHQQHLHNAIYSQLVTIIDRPGTALVHLYKHLKQSCELVVIWPCINRYYTKVQCMLISSFLLVDKTGCLLFLVWCHQKNFSAIKNIQVIIFIEGNRHINWGQSISKIQLAAIPINLHSSFYILGKSLTYLLEN